MKRLVRENKHIDICSMTGSTADVIDTYHTLLADGYVEIRCIHDWDADTWEAVRYREETDEEYGARKDIENKRAARQVKRAEASLEKKRKEYERLKKLFEEQRRE